VGGARRYGDGVPGAAEGLVAATTQENVAVEDLELLLLGTVDVFRRDKGCGAQLEVHLGDRAAGLPARPHEGDPFPGHRVLDDITRIHHSPDVAATRSTDLDSASPLPGGSHRRSLGRSALVLRMRRARSQAAGCAYTCQSTLR
jgi:hypothetical protein